MTGQRMHPPSPLRQGGGSGLADILERILDKGVVVAGDVAIHLVGVELLTIRLRLVIASVDKAKELGIGWWERDPFLAGAPNGTALPAPMPDPERALLEVRNQELEARLRVLEAKLGVDTP